jgi:hypothetical protein
MKTTATTTIAGSWQMPGLTSLVANISLTAIGQIVALVKLATQQAQKGYLASSSVLSCACLPRPVFATTNSNHAFRVEAVGSDRCNTKRTRIIQGGSS